MKTKKDNNINPIPKEYRKQYCGCKPNPVDSRDITLGHIAYIPDKKCPSYERGFCNEKKYGRLVRDHQGSSSSCVGQGWSKYLEMLNLIEMIMNYIKKYDKWPSQEEIQKMLNNLSAKDIYSQIFLPQNGAYIRSGAKLTVNVGCCEESFISSYPEKTRYNTGNPDETFMREKKQTPESKNNALIYQPKLFVYLPTQYPMTEQNWEDVRQVIWQFGGFVSGYERHCVYFSGYGIDPNNGLRYIEYINSYGKDFGEDGKGKWFEKNGRIFDITFLVDQPNPNIMTPQKRNMIVNIHHELLCRKATNEEIQLYSTKSEKVIREEVGKSNERKQIIRIVNFARTFKLISNS